MAYTKHTWTDGDILTAEKLNQIEAGIEEANKNSGVQGPAGAKGDPGPAGEKGEKGDAGAGLVGVAAVLTSLAPNTQIAGVVTKINEVIGVLNTRGVSKAK